jgi:hypothetical protein
MNLTAATNKHAAVPQPPTDVPDRPHLLLTELRPTGTLLAGKQILPDGSIMERPLIKRWRHQQVGFNSIKGFYEYVAEIQHDNAIIIRGVTDATSRIVFRRKQCAKEPNGFLDRRAALLPLDIDDVAVGTWTANPRKTVDTIVRRLGEPFTSTSYVAQLTGTHGLIRDADKRWTGEIGGDVMSVRVFFMTERGISADEAEAWLNLLRDTLLPEIDASVGRRVQPIYLARPLWHDHDGDPLGDIRRCWMVRRKREFLPVPDDLAVRARWIQTTGRAVARKLVKGVQAADVEEAVASIGTPLGGGEGRGGIYDWVLQAARLLVAAHPINGNDIEGHAWNLRDQLATMIADKWDCIVANLKKHERQDDASVIEKYLQDDVARWIVWLIEHGVTKKTIRRGSAKQVSNDDDDEGGELMSERELIDLIGEDFIDDAEAFYQTKEARKAEREAEWLKHQKKGKKCYGH